MVQLLSASDPLCRSLTRLRPRVPRGSQTASLSVHSGSASRLHPQTLVDENPSSRWDIRAQNVGACRGEWTQWQPDSTRLPKSAISWTSGGWRFFLCPNGPITDGPPPLHGSTANTKSSTSTQTEQSARAYRGTPRLLSSAASGRAQRWRDGPLHQPLTVNRTCSFATTRWRSAMRSREDTSSRSDARQLILASTLPPTQTISHIISTILRRSLSSRTSLSRRVKQ
jgi:hypothetical protein